MQQGVEVRHEVGPLATVGGEEVGDEMGAIYK
jgi:hypothetical protein